MIKLLLNGKPFDAQILEETILKQSMEAAGGELRKKISGIRLPVTGEFPTIVVFGSSTEDLKVRVEGSPELLKLVKERLQLTENGLIGSPMATMKANPPKVFLSYAWEDQELV